jgi:hypothetical protein
MSLGAMTMLQAQIGLTACYKTSAVHNYVFTVHTLVHVLLSCTLPLYSCILLLPTRRRSPFSLHISNSTQHFITSSIYIEPEPCTGPPSSWQCCWLPR